MKKLKLKSLLLVLFFLLGSVVLASGQAVAIKKWKGRYPQMKNKYPATFIAFKGWLPPVPHLFVKTPFTHYYWKVKSVPATDGNEIKGKIKTGFQRIAMKMMERSQFKGRYKETAMIQIMNGLQKQIDQKLFDSRSEHLEDIYELSDSFVYLYQKLDQFNHLEKGSEMKKLLQKEVNALLEDFLLVNFLDTKQGEKFQAFSDLKTSLTQLSGEIDYSYDKLKYFNSFQQKQVTSYAFLTQ